jgi:WXG100 family type VII secretion target
VTGFSVTPGDLAAADGFLAATAAHTRSALRQVQAEASGLFEAGWQGTAASAFRLTWEQWLEGAQAVLGAMETLAALLGTAGTGYQETDTAVGTGFARAAS